MAQYQVTAHHKAGFVAEYPHADTPTQAKSQVLSQLIEMAKPFRITSIEVSVYMTDEELKLYQEEK